MLASSNARRLQGRGVSSTAPTDGQGLVFVASSGLWVPTTLAGSGDVLHTRQIIAGTGLSGGGDLSADRTLSLAAGGTGFTQLATNVVQRTTILLTSAQIKALHGTPISAVADPGVNKMLVLVGGLVWYKRGTTSYVNADTSAHLSLDLGTNAGAAAVLLSHSMLTGSISQRFAFSGPFYNNASGAQTSFEDLPGIADYSHLAFNISNDGSSTDFSAGDGTVSIELLYRIVDLSVL